jgi:hypothetical protein
VGDKIVPGMYSDADIPYQRNLLFTNLEPIVGGMTLTPKPAFYDGAISETIAEQVRKDLSPSIIPAIHQRILVVPNFFLETISPWDIAFEAKRRTCYHGALGARTMHELRSLWCRKAYL